MPGQAKARFFMAFGFKEEEWEVIADALLEHGRAYPVVNRKVSRFGEKFEIKGALRCPDGRNPEVWTVWQLDKDGLAPRLITAYPAQP